VRRGIGIAVTRGEKQTMEIEQPSLTTSKGKADHDRPVPGDRPSNLFDNILSKKKLDSSIQECLDFRIAID
jgi:hypothetical protein